MHGHTVQTTKGRNTHQGVPVRPITQNTNLSHSMTMMIHLGSLLLLLAVPIDARLQGMGRRFLEDYTTPVISLKRS